MLADLAEALDVEGLPDTARATLTTVHAYLERHREHIDYAAYKELGLPLGSGMVESACKWLIQQRFKGVGMRWSEDGFNHLLPLKQNPQSTRRNNFPGGQISRWFLLLSENLSASNYPGAALSELKKKEAALESVNTAFLRTRNPDDIAVTIERAGEEAEMDEMGSFVGNKGTPRWLWHAIDHHTGVV